MGILSYGYKVGKKVITSVKPFSKTGKGFGKIEKNKANAEPLKLKFKPVSKSKKVNGDEAVIVGGIAAGSYAYGKNKKEK
tara:strand:- start:117 stop:356 length:240 start_codon:yes stop_codon:yes gene_type:complete